MSVTFKLRRGPASEWTLDNPILAGGEPGFEIDTGRFKIGDGVQSWNSLPYYPTNTVVSALIQAAISSANIPKITIASTAPSAPAVNDIWVDTSA